MLLLFEWEAVFDHWTLDNIRQFIQYRMARQQRRRSSKFDLDDEN